MMKQKICALTGAIGGAVAAAFGGWTLGLQCLVICMAVDYCTGLAVAGIFHASPKTNGGGLESLAGWKGLARKAMTLLIVLIAHQIDLMMGSAYIKEAVIIGFTANEVISILENAGLMGLPIPKVLKNAIELLKDKSDPEIPGEGSKHD